MDLGSSQVWLFAKPEDPKLHAGQFLRYVGNAGDHPVLQRFLEGKLAPLTYETAEEKRALYQPKRLMDLAPGAVIARVISAGIIPENTFLLMAHVLIFVCPAAWCNRADASGV